MPRQGFDPYDVFEGLTETEKTAVLDSLEDEISRWKEQVRKVARDCEFQLQRIRDELDNCQRERQHNDAWFNEERGREPERALVDCHIKKAKELHDRDARLNRELADAKTISDDKSAAVANLEALEENEWDRRLEATMKLYVNEVRARQVFSAIQAQDARIEEDQRAAREKAQQLRREWELNRNKERERQKTITAEEIRRACTQRGIDRLYHFTPFENVSDIVSSGGLYSREALSILEETAIKPDSARLDGWNNWISVSVSFPNDKLFYVFRTRPDLARVAGWAVLQLNASVLWENECRYVPSNAACSDRRVFDDIHWSSERAFERLFLNLQMRQDIPDRFPTDPQAEVMVYEHIPTSYIQAILVPEAQAISRLGSHDSIPVTVEPRVFNGRHDWDYWRGRRVPFD
jgi:hypothetical protein